MNSLGGALFERQVTGDQSKNSVKNRPAPNDVLKRWQYVT